MSEQAPKQRKEIEDIADSMMSGIAGLAEAMSVDETTRGVHSTRRFAEVAKDGFGEFTKRWDYTEGCVVSNELAKDEVGEILISMETDNGRKRLIGIGPTPSEWKPTKGGKQIPEAGESGDFLMVVFDSAFESGEKPKTYRYLDLADIDSMRVELGSKDIPLSVNQVRGRQLKLPGTVVEATGLVK